MKKFVGIFTGLFLGLVLVSCSERPEEIVSMPDIKPGKDEIIISFDRIENVKYINVYRAEIEKDKVKEETIVNIGQVVPKSEKRPVFIFSDRFFVSDQRYSYRVRYWNGKNYKYSSWTDPVSAYNGKYLNREALKYNVLDGIYYEYDDSIKTFTLKGFSSTEQIDDIDKLESYYTSSGTKFNPGFVFTFGEGMDEVTKLFCPKDRIELTKTAKPVGLRSVLTTDFLDRDIKFKALVGQIVEYQRANNEDPDSELYYVTYYWSLPAEMKIEDEDQKVVDVIRIPSNTAEEGGDYSNLGVDGNNEASKLSSVNIVAGLDY